MSIPGLTGKFAVVTGSSSGGIGQAIATVLARSGAFVTVHGRSEGSVNKSIAAIIEENSSIDKNLLIPIVGDVGVADGCDRFIEGVEKIIAERKFAGVDILVNNVGIFDTLNFAEISDADWARYHEINVMSGVRLARHYFPKMLDRNAGRVIFIASEAGVRTLPLMIPYSVSKASQIAVARGLAELTKGTDVTVNSVLPGPTMTRGVRQYLQNFAKEKNVTLDQATTEYFKEHEPNSLIQRFLRPEEIANTVAFISSDLASAINGSSIRAEGGIIRHV